MNAPLTIIAQADPGAGYRALKPEIDAAVARALRLWEPRFRLTKIALSDISPGKVTVEMQGVYLVSGQPVTLDGLTIG